MIVVLNGSLGVGKTSTAWALNASFERSVMLDGDNLGAVEPFDLHDPARVSYLYRTLAHVIAFHQQNGYPTFVIDYVFESADSLAELLRLLAPLDPDLHTFWLTCHEDEQWLRVMKRGGDQLEWELHRFRQLNTIQRSAARAGHIGEEIDTTGLSVDEVVERIRRKIGR